MDIVNLLMVAILIMLTAFFVATEFAVVKVRSTQIEHLVEEGDKKALDAKKLIDNLDNSLSACQLGITITSLGLGWLGEPTIQALLKPVFTELELSSSLTSLLSFLIAFFAITFLHVVVGELAPKTMAIQKAETIVLNLAKPLLFFTKIMYPFIWLLNGSANQLVRIFGFHSVKESEVAMTEEELRLILSESYKSGEINQSEMMYVNNIFDFDERLAKEIMVPRTEMFCLYKEDSYEENIEMIREGQFTRYPVAEEDKDHIVGLVNLKEIFTGHFAEEPISLEQFIRPIIHVSEATPIKQVLLKMQKERIHMAIVMDEYGGTAGLVTVEDILEEIVGDIRDEFDANEEELIEEIDSNTMIVSGRLLLTELNEKYHIDLLGEEDVDIDTVGGWILANHLDAEQGTTVEADGYAFIVEEIDGYQIKRVKVTRL
ncbi:hemolysin family protein [Aciduricibacillus chroicocephali]|uniref:Hemolysin family protein n=1 Tax=Aciduricibacillus chroicocephali TaxID=3054939 RepID=A0ABY9KT53_9BACI|nr:hemolysin family protein [Bacillaceae bacterium 44XB]